jgi:serine/threonine protein kinase
MAGATGGSLGAEFQGGDRFEIRKRLGHGAMGVVYEAFDRERQHRLALKTLREVTPQRLYRFKQEFRTLAGVVHPNLVTLYELLCVEDQWLFTMELIDGVDFLSYVRPRDSRSKTDAHGPTYTGKGASGSRPRTPTATEATMSIDISVLSRPPSKPGHSAAAAPLPRPDAPEPSQFDAAKLRLAARQLAQGIHALHSRGHLHRDVKPSNVLVTPQGRVVLLDFGVATTLGGFNETLHARRLVGTPAYMSPEQQSLDQELTPASDWYAFGLMLYEAATGRRAFVGTSEDVLSAKRMRRWIPARELIADLPSGLDALCTQLLQPLPAARPNGAEILNSLGVVTAAHITSDTAMSGATAVRGRRVQIDRLERAFRTAREQGMTVLVHGSSGMGKTALVEKFLDARTREGVTVLSGRCYERESVPYRAVDGLIDALSRLLVSLPAEDVEALLPDDVLALSRVFPVLRRVEAVALMPPRLGGADPMEVRQRAFRGLRELVARLTERGPLVLFIDDLQWGDLDSAALLMELIRPPQAPRCLLLGSYRSEDATTSPLLRSLLPWRERTGATLLIDLLELGPLEPPEALALATASLGEQGSAELAAAVARESGGCPYFIQELCRFAQSVPDGSAREGLRLDEVISARLRALPEDAQRLLEVVAVAGVPVAEGVAVRAAGQGAAGALSHLSAHHMIRMRRVAHDDEIECYHDRIRESLAQSLAAARIAEVHRDLAAAFEASGRADPHTLAVHYDGAGDGERAAVRYLQAAAAAAEALAFERAAAFYQRAIDLSPAARTVDVLLRLADALGAAGRGIEASQAYNNYVEAAVASGASEEHALRGRCRAAEELLRSGHLDEGEEALRIALGGVGLRLPRRPLLSLIGLRARISLFGVRVPDPRPIDVKTRVRIDFCWNAAAVLGMTDNIKGAYFQARHLVESLRVGDRRNASVGLGLECVFRSFKGPAVRDRTRVLWGRAEKLAEESEDAVSQGVTLGCLGLSEYQFFAWRSCYDACTRALEILRGRAVGVWFQIYSIELHRLWATALLGEVGELARRVPELLREAEARGDRYAAAGLCTSRCALAWLVVDDVDGALRAARGALRSWSPRGYHLQHYWAFMAEVNTHVYAEDGAAARLRVEREWRTLTGSMLRRIATVKVDSISLWGRAALAAAEAGSSRQAMLREAEATARNLAKHRLPAASGLAALQRAGIARLSGDEETARARLTEALELFTTADMGLHAQVARFRLGQVLGGDEGAALVAAADTWMRSHDIARPDRMARLFAPGFVS